MEDRLSVFQTRQQRIAENADLRAWHLVERQSPAQIERDASRKIGLRSLHGEHRVPTNRVLVISEEQPRAKSEREAVHPLWHKLIFESGGRQGIQVFRLAMSLDERVVDAKKCLSENPFR